MVPIISDRHLATDVTSMDDSTTSTSPATPITHMTSPDVDSPRRRRSTISSSYLSAMSSSSSPDVASDSAVVTPESDEELLGDVAPKVEELDDDDDNHRLLADLEDTKPDVHGDGSSIVPTAAAPTPRKRGRPRKHPIVEQKKSHARSKTGCGTCRRRKKKCDESKPVCMNCEKNNVVCDGYEPKQHWQSGKQRALTSLRNNAAVPPRLPLLVEGIDGAVDQMFFQYFTCQLGNVLSLTDQRNPFLEIIVPMSMSHRGLMHSVLYLSSSCLIANDPNAKDDWQERQDFHSSRAIHLLKDDLARSSEPEAGNALAPIGDPSIAQTLVLCLQTVCAGDVTGSYRFHLNAMKEMLMQEQRPFPNEELRQFILEFLLYHDYSSSITSLKNPLDSRSLKLMEDFQLPEYMIPPQAGALLGVLDGLFGFISRIRHLRDEMRARRAAHAGFWWQAPMMDEVFAIDNALREWHCVHEPGTPRWAASMLYRQCTLIYLQRTIQPSAPSAAFAQLVDDGLRYLRMLPSPETPGVSDEDSSTQAVLLMPLFLLGCAAFDRTQRPEISAALDRLQQWSNLGNIKYARVIVEDVWEMMDQGREQDSWDWETAISKRNWSFLIT